MRKILIVPLDEIKLHFAENRRQDVKIVTPELLSSELLDILKAQGKEPKPETRLVGNRWHHAPADEPNLLSESHEFSFEDLSAQSNRPFTLSFANENAVQDEHYHKQHLEIYFSEHRFAARFRCVDEERVSRFELTHGGAAVFGPGVIHKLELTGLTIVIGIPAVTSDKYEEKL